MKSFLIVDGYNIINSWQSLKPIASRNMEEAREKLIEILSSYGAFTGKKVIVVFDAHFVKGSSEKEKNINGIQVVFTKEHQTADSYIEKTVHRLPKVHLIQVATSDWAEQQTVLSSGGARMSARELEEEIKFIQGKMDKKYVNKKIKNNDLSHRIEPHILKQLEKWRKSQE